jgi:hypothetical protein
MRCTKSTLIDRARLRTAVGPMADPRRAAPRRAMSARAALLMATVLLVAPALSTASAAASVPPMVPDLCADKAPLMPASTGPQVPAVRVQMQGAWLAPGSASATLALAYEEFNDMKCTRYQQNYEEAAPRYLYFDCVGFTGYTLEQADPRAWASLRRVVEFQAGQVTPTPLEFVDFLRDLMGIDHLACWLSEAGY